MGPLNEAMKAELRKQQRDYTYDIDWTTLGELSRLARSARRFAERRVVRRRDDGAHPRARRDGSRPDRGGARAHAGPRARGDARGRARRRQLADLRAGLLREDRTSSMALARAAGESGGGYVSHMRSESEPPLEAIDELLRSRARAAGMARSTT